VANSREYIERLKLAVEHLHKCSARHLESVPVTETFRGETAWEGTVEVFDITGHPKATRCYAWSHLDGADDSDERFVAVLGVPPVDSPLKAVQVSIVADAKKQKK
jgi:hypothetical protein